MVTKYDDASWHYGENLPNELSNEAGATHIGMFLAWALINDLGSDLHTENSLNSLKKLKNREITGSKFLQQECDDIFTEEDLNIEGNLFAKYYFNGEGGKGQYLDDYDVALCSDLDSIYDVKDTWGNFDKLKPYIDQAYEKWKKNITK